MRLYAAASNVGNRRSTNEDSYVADADLDLWVVADGLGGHQSGEVASSMACDVILNDVRKGATLNSAIAHAHSRVLQAIEATAAPSNMGTTVVALRIDGNAYEIAWVGDSRAYLFDEELRLLTRDHSAVNDLIESGIIDPEEARAHPQRHVLSRSLGVSSSVASEASTISGTLGENDRILLCTDGLTDELSDSEIGSELRNQHGLQAQADALIDAALARGGRDNITLIIVGGSPD